MLKSIISVIISAETFLASLLGCFGNVKLPETDGFVPVIRFIACSDTHVKAAGDKACIRIQKAIRAGYEAAKADKNYQKLDAVMFAGDLTNSGMKSQYLAFKSSVDAALEDETALMAVIAKSHDSTAMGKDALKYFTSLTGLDTDYHYCINGFHFIGISTSAVEGEHYSEYQRQWLKEQLDYAANDDASKPIFVTQHEHISGTVYGSSETDGWGMDYFKDILEKYPQVVDFSGHSHYPINDPRSIWQGEFTAVGTGEMSYVEFTVDGERKIHPSDCSISATAWIVEVDADNRVRLRGIEVNKGKLMCEYIINNPADSEAFEFKPELMAAKSEKPEFTGSALIKTYGLFGNYRLKFRAADSMDNMPVFLYRANVFNEQGEQIQSKWTLSGYYLAEAPNEITIKLDKLNKGKYTVKVYAETAYGVESEPLITSISV